MIDIVDAEKAVSAHLMTMFDVIRPHHRVITSRHFRDFFVAIEDTHLREPQFAVIQCAQVSFKRSFRTSSHNTGALDALTTSPWTSLALLHLPNASLGRTEAVDAFFLVFTEPGLGGFAQDTFAQVIHEMADHDERERDGIHPVDPVVEDSDADDDTPEVAGQERDVLEGGAGEAVQDGDQSVEEGEDEGIPSQVAGDFAVPGGVAECLAVKDAGLDTVDDGSPEAKLANDLV